MRASGGPSICPTCRGLWGRSGCSPARSSPGAAAAGSEKGRGGEKGGFRGGPDHLKKKNQNLEFESDHDPRDVIGLVLRTQIYQDQKRHEEALVLIDVAVRLAAARSKSQARRGFGYYV